MEAVMPFLLAEKLKLTLQRLQRYTPTLNMATNTTIQPAINYKYTPL